MAAVLSGQNMKRIFDLIAVSIALLILWPIFITIALIVRIRLGRPVIFCQKRPGLNAEPFYIYKFRSMNSALDKHGELLPDEQRLTVLGKFLRKYSLDELPQLFNVLKGDISLVGPRPLLMDYLPLYSKEQARRHEVRPGITGWAQVNGRNAITWEDKFKLDVWYVDHQSISLDIKIIIITVFKIFKPEGISQDNQATMTKFQGSKH